MWGWLVPGDTSSDHDDNVDEDDFDDNDVGDDYEDDDDEGVNDYDEVDDVFTRYREKGDGERGKRFSSLEPLKT